MREAATVDSLPWVGWGNGVSARWIDNDQVLFGAYDRQLRKQVDRFGKMTSVGLEVLYLWDTRTGGVKRHWPGQSLPFCVAGDYLTYTITRNGRSVYRGGRFGNEREFEVIPQLDANGKELARYFNRFTCQVQWLPDLLGPNKGIVTPLRTEHGIFEDNKSPAVSRSDEPPRRWLHKPDGTTLELSLPNENDGLIGYSTYLKAYVLGRRQNLLKRGITNNVHLLFPDTGQVNALEIPGSEHWTYLSDVRPTRIGLVGAGHEINIHSAWDPGDAGLYLFYGAAIERFFSKTAVRPSNGKPDPGTVQVERLSRGLIRDLDVSEDGCKVLMLIDPSDRKNRKAYLRVVDVCKKGR